MAPDTPLLIFTGPPKLLDNDVFSAILLLSWRRLCSDSAFSTALGGNSDLAR